MNEMNLIGKEISNPFSTGGGGVHFEAHVQASFVILMLADGFVPCLPTLPINKIKLQGKIDGYETDDLIVFMEKPDGTQRQKLLAQIKYSMNFTAGDPTFSDVIQSAWQDFGNSSLFSKRQDAIAVITGPLNATDIEGARGILEWARSCETAEEFVRKVDAAKFSSDLKRSKLAAFRVQLSKANENSEVTDDQLFQFLRHFHILSYDLDVKSGVVLSLLHSLMNQFSMDNVRAIWTQIVDEVQTANKTAGTVTKDNLPQDLRSAFQRQEYATIPEAYAPAEQEKLDLNQLAHASTIALANLVGGWDENRNADCTAIARLVDEDFSRWISKLQDVLQIPNSPIKLRDGEWHVTNRSEVWQTLGQRVFDKSMDAFKVCATSILGESDPKFDLPPAERFGVSFEDKALSYSRAIKRGMAETLALMGADSKALSNCSDQKVRTVAILSLREIFKDADWKTWGSLNDLLPLLAEAAPEEFLATVERDLGHELCPFDELFKQEGDGITGENYLTGLLWALESLAWDRNYLVQVCVLLSELASRDPGGRSGNRPINSLVTILLPWLPQTEASIEKRKVAIQTISKEQPNIAWALLLKLLPKQQQMSMRSHRPTFRKIASAEKDQAVTHQEYWEQVSQFAELVIELANGDVARLSEFADVLDRLPLESVSAFGERLASINFESKPIDETVRLWKKLNKFISKQRRLADQNETVLPPAIISMEAIARSIEPKNPAYQYQQLFGYNDREFYRDSGDNWEEKGKQQEERRRRAIKEILDYGDLAAIREFIELADESIFVGHTLGTLEENTDSHFLPTDLSSENRRVLQFLFGYTRARFHKKGWEWVQQLPMSTWSPTEIGKFLSFLPFSSDTWTRVKELLGDQDSQYWINVNPNPYEANADLEYAIDKLIKNERPILAIACLNRALHDKQPLDVRQAEQALLALIKHSDFSQVADRYDVIEVIKALQEAPDADPNIVAKIEWQFLQLLDRDFGGAPKSLEHRLASNPEFFCEVIRLLYRSKHEPKEDKRELSAQEEAMMKNAWTLLREWQHPPGLHSDGTFSPEQFTEWLHKTRELCTESGHLSVALTHIGCVLFYSPADPDGLWLHKTIAEALNDRDADKLRVGFRQQIFNSRGVHWVDPSGQQERDLSEQYRIKAEAIENAGFQRLAAALRELSESYARQAEQVVREAEADKLEDEE